MCRWRRAVWLCRIALSTVLRCRLWLPKRFRVARSAPIASLLLATCCLALSAYWVVVRHADHSWLLQDLLGVSLCIYIIKSFTIAKLKVSQSVLCPFVQCSIAFNFRLQSLTVLLTLLIVYDVMMVFISPFIVRVSSTSRRLYSANESECEVRV